MVYLEKPNTDIDFVQGHNHKHQTRFTAAEMQGWRINMVRSTCFKLHLNVGGCSHLQFGLYARQGALCGI